MENRVHPELKTFFSAMEDLHLTRENIAQSRGAMNEMLSGDEVKMENVKISERFIASPNGPQTFVFAFMNQLKHMALYLLFYIFMVGDLSLAQSRCLMQVVRCLLLT
ncbi:hypothetical protein [Lysinibacillus sp. FSL K6-3209]|uniref:hypothetical protein n=1 Tax=Lysinibacillus sp. FSL K6-3209 TaxID=2921497 RepID=UPI0030D874A2